MTTSPTRAALLRLAVLSAVLVIIAVVMVVFQPFSRVQVEHAVHAFGPAAPLAYIVIGGVLGALFVPGPLLAAVSGALFGTWEGFVVSMASTLVTSVLALLLSRRGGRDSVNVLTNERAAALIDFGRRRGLLVVIVQRWIPGIPDAPFSYVFGAIGLGVPAVALGTLIGSAPRGFAYTALGDASVTGSRGLAAAAITVGLTVSLLGLVAGGLLLRAHRRRTAEAVGAADQTEGIAAGGGNRPLPD